MGLGPYKAHTAGRDGQRRIKRAALVVHPDGAVRSAVGAVAGGHEARVGAEALEAVGWRRVVGPEHAAAVGAHGAVGAVARELHAARDVGEQLAVHEQVLRRAAGGRYYICVRGGQLGLGLQ